MGGWVYSSSFDCSGWMEHATVTELSCADQFRMQIEKNNMQSCNNSPLNLLTILIVDKFKRDVFVDLHSYYYIDNYITPYYM